MTTKDFKFDEVVSNFQVKGNCILACPYGSGHINDTFLINLSSQDSISRYIFQRINHYIFKSPVKLMDNISRVLVHLTNLETNSDPRRHMTLIPTKKGGFLHVDKDGNYWRAYVFIEGARTYDVLESPQQAYEAAKAFGKFQKQLSSLGGERLHDTIPDFHNTPKRFEALIKIIEKDPCNRANLAKKEIDFVLKRSQELSILEKLKETGEIPEIITHNDTKINNVMLDDKTGEAVCVIDLDTVMPGISLYDFGDMVRTSGASSAEDEKDLSKVRMRLEIFESLASGYLLGSEGGLNRVEIEKLPFSGKLITLEIGIRFLTDFIEGDVYFKTKRDGHNLDRTKVQFKLVESIEAQEEQMMKIVKTIIS
jgi:hypothetical protein